MPIRTLPLAQISEATLRDMIAREIRESRTLDFKQDLRLDDSGRLDLLADVTAMANASGGAILYGAIEGEGEKRGQIVDLAGLPIAPDQTGLTISNLLRDGIDEPILNIEQREIGLERGGYAYVIRVPPSYLAPHMVTKRSHRDRFFARATVSNDPMTARQIKELAVRNATAIERVEAVMVERQQELQRRMDSASLEHNPVFGQVAGPNRGGLVLHVLPLFPPIEGIDLADPQLDALLRSCSPYNSPHGGGLNLWTLEGIYREEGALISRPRWMLLLRSGGLEFADTAVAPSIRETETVRGFSIYHHEQQMLDALQQARRLADVGLLELPLAIGLHLRGMRGVYLRDSRDGGFSLTNANQRYDDITVPAQLVHAWSDVPGAMRRIFDAIWQAWGVPRSLSYAEDGTRRG